MGRCSELGSCRLICRGAPIDQPLLVPNGGCRLRRKRRHQAEEFMRRLHDPPRGLPMSAPRCGALAGLTAGRTRGVRRVRPPNQLDGGGIVIRASSASIVTIPSIGMSATYASSETPLSW